MIPWMRQERSLLTGKGAFLWVQNDLHISSVSLKLQSEGMHPSSSGCVAGETSHFNCDFWKGAACYPFGGEVSFREAPQY